MRTLAEIQLGFRNAVIDGDTNQLAHVLTGGQRPEKRLTVHQHNYETSLVDALLVKFPATGWLIGTPFLEEGARKFVREHSPEAPCIAEYGASFPDFLSRCAGAERIPYLRDFSELEWHIGQLAVAVEFAPTSGDAFAGIPPDALPNLRLTLQPGLRYLHVSWPVDELMKLYLTETASEQLELAPADVWLELRGARGAFQFNRVDPPDFMFRKCISQGWSIGEAAERTLDVDGNFDPGQALTALIANGLVIAVAQPPGHSFHDGI
jgi:hypothetical protein